MGLHVFELSKRTVGDIFAEVLNRKARVNMNEQQSTRHYRQVKSVSMKQLGQFWVWPYLFNLIIEAPWSALLLGLWWSNCSILSKALGDSSDLPF